MHPLSATTGLALNFARKLLKSRQNQREMKVREVALLSSIYSPNPPILYTSQGVSQGFLFEKKGPSY